jgi:hypothetical protein
LEVRGQLQKHHPPRKSSSFSFFGAGKKEALHKMVDNNESSLALNLIRNGASVSPGTLQTGRSADGLEKVGRVVLQGHNNF